eukprot:Amastigsp_a511020_8.p2 type:complete len:165 gc:universal Amastigsp_a511020_8:99-593(+)
MQARALQPAGLAHFAPTLHWRAHVLPRSPEKSMRRTVRSSEPAMSLWSSNWRQLMGPVATSSSRISDPDCLSLRRTSPSLQPHTIFVASKRTQRASSAAAEVMMLSGCPVLMSHRRMVRSAAHETSSNPSKARSCTPPVCPLYERILCCICTLQCLSVPSVDAE